MIFRQFKNIHFGIIYEMKLLGREVDFFNMGNKQDSGKIR